MCGITGKLYFTPNKSVTREEIHQMNERIKHRGPDNEGIYISPKENIGLGHRRLSIIDLSQAGHQPMSNEDGSLWVVFNGEVYNFQKLRIDLEKKGHRFRSRTDTETILHLYEDFEEKCLDYLRGMFAFAIWDERKQKLFLARDRAGQKPLKYYIGKDFIVFASELKAFLKDPAVPREIDFEAIHHYLTLQYAPAPFTGFKNIKKLPAAHYLTVDLFQKQPKIELKRYWKLNYSQKINQSEEEWQIRILDKLEECVKMRLISDVPLGTFLSGGLDSSMVVALMAKNSQQRVKTFSIGFEEKKYNELSSARLIAERFNTQHQEFIVKPDALEVLPELIWHYEEPYADSSAIPVWYLSKLTRQHVTVALNGDGGDENFAGYGMFPVYLFARQFYRYIPRMIRRGLISPLACLANRIVRNTFTERSHRFAYSFEKPNDLPYLYYISYFTPEQRQGLYQSAAKEAAGKLKTTANLFLDICNNSGAQDAIDRVLYFNFASYLPDDLLVKVDITMMAFALEGRSPMLDHKFLELTAQIPYNLKVKRFKGKYIFKKAAEKILPKEIIYRKKKGFGVPLEYWFRGPLEGYVKDVLLDRGALLHTFLKKQEIEKVLNEHQRTKINNANKLWALLTLELWFEKFFKG